MDYKEKFKVESEDNDTISKLYKLFFILDKILANSIIGNNNNSIILNRTERLRFIGIFERSRLGLPLFFFFGYLNIHCLHYDLSNIYMRQV